MGLTPTILMLLALLAPQMIDEPVEIIEDCTSSTDIYEDYECGGGYDYPDSTDLVFEMNETFTFDAFEYTFTDAYYTEASEVIDEYSLDYYEDPENILVIDFEYTNIGTYTESPSYYLSLYGDNFVVEEYAYLHSTPEVNPGRSGRGKLVYNVPDGVEVFELEITTFDYMMQGTAIVDIVVE